jgi:hypothetical protein
MLAHSGVPGSRIELAEHRACCQFPGKGVFATAPADEKNVDFRHARLFLDAPAAMLSDETKQES